MIEHLRHTAIFARVVGEGSFSAAAKVVGLAPSRVREIVSDLEDYLGTTLLCRVARKVSLTIQGRILYADVVEMMRNAEAGLNGQNALPLDPLALGGFQFRQSWQPGRSLQQSRISAGCFQTLHFGSLIRTGIRVSCTEASICAFGSGGSKTAP
ncbi:MAG: hypothetical protein C0524_15375 [Rhodobacter sp.]|nr:hypothetical protein [Rhodobacter sp.]